MIAARKNLTAKDAKGLMIGESWFAIPITLQTDLTQESSD
jgi:hypothetical protein